MTLAQPYFLLLLAALLVCSSPAASLAQTAKTPAKPAPKEIRLNGSPVTRGGIKRLQAAVPSLKTVMFFDDMP